MIECFRPTNESDKVPLSPIILQRVGWEIFVPCGAGFLLEPATH